LRQWDVRLALQWDMLGAWLPRLVYLGVAGGLALKLLTPDLR